MQGLEHTGRQSDSYAAYFENPTVRAFSSIIFTSL